jgi:dTMP kinase
MVPEWGRGGFKTQFDQLPMNGKLFVFEGPDGTGKSTQAVRFKAFLETRGLNPLHIREPGSTPFGERVREILITRCKNDEADITPEAEMLLYMACRSQLYRTVIQPALEHGQWVILERSYYSTFAYQGFGLGLDPDMILELGQWVCQGIEPARVILLDMPVEEGLTRLTSEKDRIEERRLDFHERVRSGYKELVRRFPDLFRVVDAAASPDEVELRIHAELSDIL